MMSNSGVLVLMAVLYAGNIIPSYATITTPVAKLDNGKCQSIGKSIHLQ